MHLCLLRAVLSSGQFWSLSLWAVCGRDCTHCKGVCNRSACCRFTPAILSINAELERFADGQQDMKFVDCGHAFSYEGETGRLHAALMPDGMNLNTAGMEHLASCLDPVIHVSIAPGRLASGPSSFQYIGSFGRAFGKSGCACGNNCSPACRP